jgi:hypothetical protein
VPTPQRLPAVDGDDGVWGDILNQFIEKEHYNSGADNAANGGHQKITIRAGSATAGTAPLKFTSGTILTSPEAGAVEFDTDKLYFTQTTGPTRKVVAAYDDTSGATGDLYYRDSSGNFTRLGVGSGVQVLRVNSGLPSWGQVIMATASKTANYTITANDTVILGDATSGNVTITLPLASIASGYRFCIKKSDSSANSVIIARSGSDTIDGSTSATVSVQYVSLTVVSDGSNWYII